MHFYFLSLFPYTSSTPRARAAAETCLAGSPILLRDGPSPPASATAQHDVPRRVGRPGSFFFFLRRLSGFGRELRPVRAEISVDENVPVRTAKRKKKQAALSPRRSSNRSWSRRQAAGRAVQGSHGLTESFFSCLRGNGRHWGPGNRGGTVASRSQ